MSKHTKLINDLLAKINTIATVKNIKWYSVMGNSNNNAVDFELDGLPDWHWAIWSNLEHIYRDVGTEYFFFGEPKVLLDKWRPSAVPFDFEDIDLALLDLEHILSHDDWGWYSDDYSTMLNHNKRVLAARIANAEHKPKYPRRNADKFFSRQAMLDHNMPIPQHANYFTETDESRTNFTPYYWVWVADIDGLCINFEHDHGFSNQRTCHTNKQVDQVLDTAGDAEFAEIGCMYNDGRRYEYGRMWLKRFNGRWVVGKYGVCGKDYD